MNSWQDYLLIVRRKMRVCCRNAGTIPTMLGVDPFKVELDDSKAFVDKSAK
jgi:hypothetical protein